MLLTFYPQLINNLSTFHLIYPHQAYNLSTAHSKLSTCYPHSVNIISTLFHHLSTTYPHINISISHYITSTHHQQSQLTLSNSTISIYQNSTFHILKFTYSIPCHTTPDYTHHTITSYIHLHSIHYLLSTVYITSHNNTIISIYYYITSLSLSYHNHIFILSLSHHIYIYNYINLHLYFINH